MKKKQKRQCLTPVLFITISCFLFLLFIKNTEGKVLNKTSDISFFTSQYEDKYIKHCDANMANIKNPSNLNYLNCPCVPLTNKPSTDDIVCVSPLAGNYFDIWVIMKDKASQKWSKPFLTGEQLINIKDFEEESVQKGLYLNIIKLKIYIANISIIETLNGYKLIIKYKYGSMSQKEMNKIIYINNKNLIKDSDRDGLTDILEKRLGTNISKIDTDGDERNDSVDNDPTVSDKIINPYKNVINDCYNTIEDISNKENKYYTPYLLIVSFKNIPQYPVSVNRYIVHNKNSAMNSYKSMTLKVIKNDEKNQKVICAIEKGVYEGYGFSGQDIYYDVTMKGNIYIITKKYYGIII